ncbi:alpha-L-fucosidase [Roseivirga pacifica]|uniref:alpha-L-fucosidase n=1 Tax=Roseivirga pacifica TaxID=1267423 RepID=A0A1I0QK21_9BACT|nr:alpha-L-fucosidase [Roseivirga pacifica]RKQ42844.1 alpha-L-fucosidase [Roseivirga pacifica]SEW27559.1 alpha-L-fucosidase [Roseivirga pacifica]
MRNYLLIAAIGLLFFACKEQPAAPPEPIGALPTAQQMEWQEMQYYAFVHFNMNTFTDMEWGMGDEPPSSFNPSALDTRQWARIVKEAGMKGIILTAKHHDGFALWPSEFTEHSVKNSPWKNGQGDVVAELAAACKEYGLKLGLYLSPWDRNHAEYGKPEYITYYRNQMKELLTNYGEVFEFWVDGANGGDGYYGGANETRNVDRETYYDWDSTFALAKSLQPNIVIFSDGGPDVRWVGNENGFAGETNWSTLNKAEFAPGIGPYEFLPVGQEDGTDWVPAECDVSIRPGWYYHASQDTSVKSLSHLLDIYYKSVGRNGNLLLNLPVDRRGLVHEADSAALMELKATLDATFSVNLVKQGSASAKDLRGKGFEPSLAVDDSNDTYWATEDGVTEATFLLTFDNPVTFNRLMLQEYVPLGQRIKAFEIYADLGEKEYKKVGAGTTVGYKRILRMDEVTTTSIQIKILDSKAAPTLSNIGLFMAKTEPPVEKKTAE